MGLSISTSCFLYIPFRSRNVLMPPSVTNITFQSKSKTFFIGKCGLDPLQNLVTIPKSFTAINSSPIGEPINE